MMAAVGPGAAVDVHLAVGAVLGIGLVVGLIVGIIKAVTGVQNDVLPANWSP